MPTSHMRMCSISHASWGRSHLRARMYYVQSGVWLAQFAHTVHVSKKRLIIVKASVGHHHYIRRTIVVLYTVQCCTPAEPFLASRKRWAKRYFLKHELIYGECSFWAFRKKVFSFSHFDRYNLKCILEPLSALSLSLTLCGRRRSEPVTMINLESFARSNALAQLVGGDNSLAAARLSAHCVHQIPGQVTFDSHIPYNI